MLKLAAIDARFQLARLDVAAGAAPLLHASQQVSGTDQQRHQRNHAERDQKLAGSYRLDGPGIGRPRHLRDYCRRYQVTDQL